MQRENWLCFFTDFLIGSQQAEDRLMTDLAADVVGENGNGWYELLLHSLRSVIPNTKWNHSQDRSSFIPSMYSPPAQISKAHPKWILSNPKWHHSFQSMIVPFFFFFLLVFPPLIFSRRTLSAKYGVMAASLIVRWAIELSLLWECIPKPPTCILTHLLRAAHAAVTMPFKHASVHQLRPHE